MRTFILSPAALLLLMLPLGAAAQTSASPPDRTTLAAKTKAEFIHAWEGYKKYATGYDDLLPLSKTGKNWHAHTLMMTPIDSLDTMILMGMKEEADKTRALIVRDLSFDQDFEVKNFEITIRILGGLLSSYQLTNDKRLLTLADDLGTRLLPVFNSPTGLPYMFVNLKTGKTSGIESNPAEIGTLILEFGTLSKLTGKDVYFTKAKKALVELYKRRDPKTGLIGSSINVETGKWISTSSHIGGGIDSYYEYLAKCERLFADAECGAMSKDGLRAVNQYLADETPSGLWYGSSEMTTGARTRTTYGSLQAFLPSVLAFTGDLDHAKRLQDSSFKMWSMNGIEPESLDYKEMKITRAGYELRPEIIESAYYLDRYTKDPKYVAMGEVMLNDLIKYCRTDTGYTILKDVATKEKGDFMHSFFLAETLKYAYLLFNPDALDFKGIVFNTEAHPLRKTW
ncbi:MAG: glycoside hydrolase family 47 protein [Vicinamibacteria bacterium]